MKTIRFSLHFKSRLSAACLLFVLLFSACVSQSPGPESGGSIEPILPSTVEPTTDVSGNPGPVGMPKLDPLERTINELKVDSGVTVEMGDLVDQPFFSVPGRILKIDGQSVQIFVLNTSAEAESSVENLAPVNGQPKTIVDWVDQANFWRKAEVIMLYVGKDEGVIQAISKVMGENRILNPGSTGGDMVTKENSPAVTAAKNAVATKLSIDASQVEYISAELVEWPDACLGLPQPGQMCADVITPGYNVQLRANGQTYEVHTNETGSHVRIK